MTDFQLGQSIAGSQMKRSILIALFIPLALVAQSPRPADQDTAIIPAGYTLGTDDQLLIHVLDLEEINKESKAVRIDMRGNIILPIAGRIHAAGLTVEELEKVVAQKLASVLQEPDVTISIAEMRSQPVSVLGAVRTPGVHQIRGPKTLFEVLSLAGGLNPDAGSLIKITRRNTAGLLPLPGATGDTTGEFHVASVNVKSVMDAKNPQENIEVLPNDVISVPKADLVYVIGAVRKSGGFILAEKEKISVLQALSLAEGLDHGAAASRAKILRPDPNSEKRTEILVDVKRIMEGKAGDVSLRADDILFVPASAPKNAAMRTLEAAIQMGTGVVIYRR